MLHALEAAAMIIEALFIALPFTLGLALGAERLSRALAAWVVLEVFLLWLSCTALRQPLLAALATTLLLSGTAFVMARLLCARWPRLRSGASVGLAFVGGALLTGVVAGGLEAPLRKEAIQTAKWAEAGSGDVWGTVTQRGALASERALGLRLGLSEAPRCRLDADGVEVRSCEVSSGHLEQRVTEWQAPSHVRIELVERELRNALFHFTAAEYSLKPFASLTYVLRTTDYESRLVPVWLWRPLERELVLAEHREAVDGFPGRFVALERDDRGVRVRLSVKTNPPTRVTVVPPDSSARALVVLGQTPIDEASGARVGDTVLLENEEKGIRYEQVIEYGEPNELKLISKVFRER